MCKSSPIRKVTHIKKAAALLLLLFTFSMVPKLVLHSMLASHKDSALVYGDRNDTILKSRSFNCDCSSLVVDLPFLYESSEFSQTFIVHSTALENLFGEKPVLRLTYARESRGPPASHLPF